MDSSLIDHNYDNDHDKQFEAAIAKKLKVVCVGDSITEGSGASNYPSFLRSRLDAGAIEVVNLGRGGRTMMKQGDFPYWKEEAYAEALESRADVIVLLLGTNDSKKHNWDEEQYERDYVEMVQQFQNMESSPTIWLVIPPPLHVDGAMEMQQEVINHHIPRKIRKIAETCSIPEHQIIDLFETMGGKGLFNPNYFLLDGCHPNSLGYFIMAETIAEALCLPIEPVAEV